MNSGLHRLEMNSDERGFTEIKINGKPIKCCGYHLSQCPDELPTFEIEVPVEPFRIDETVIVQIRNKHEIAKLMSPGEFEKFCEIWHKMHNNSEK